MTIKWIRHEQIEAWADRQTAQALLPKLIAKLILATNNSVKKLCFPYDNAIVLPGFDGVCWCESSSFLIPEGVSVWEIGTERDYFKKYNEDIKKRTNDSGHFKIQETTFVFVTPRMWNKNKEKGKEDFIKSEIEKYGWKDIRIIDSFDLESWLEQAPTVAVWFIEEMGISINGLQSPLKYYSSYAKTIKGILPYDFFLGNNRGNVFSDYIKSFEYKLEKQPYDLYIDCDSGLESIITLIAYLKENNYNNILNRLVIVLNSQGLRNLFSYDRCNFIPIIGYTLKEEDQQYFNEQPHIIPRVYVFNQWCLENSSMIKLSCMTKDSLLVSLCNIGYNKVEANQLINSTNCNVDLLLKKISSNPCLSFGYNSNTKSKNNLRVLLPAVVVNKWSDKNKCDKKILSILFNSDYEIYRNSLDPWLQQNDSCITIEDSDYWIYSGKEIWLDLNKFITVDFVDKFKNLLLKNFTNFLATDYEIINNKENVCSPGLAEGIIHSIFMLKILINDNKLTNINKNVFDADSIVCAILENAYTNTKWFLIEHWLSKLAEAAPNGFLVFLENHINKNDFKNFLDDKNIYPIIWALEILSQIEDYSIRAILMLMSLCDYNDSAIESLNECLGLWYSQSAISFENKKKFIKKIIQSKTIYRFKIVDLWLDTFKSVAVHQNPIWTKINFAIGRLNDNDYNDLRCFVTENFVENIDSSLECWQIIIYHFDCFILFEDKVIAKLIEIQKEMNFDTKIDICIKVANLISLEEKRNNFQNKTINLLREIYSSLSIIDEIRLIVYFTHIDLTKLVKGEKEFDSQMLITRELSNYYNKYGLDAVIAVLPKIQFKDSFANAFSELLTTNLIGLDSIFEIKLKDDYIARCIVRHVLEKNASLINFNAVKNDDNRMWLISCLPLIQNTLNIIVKEPIEVRQYFWQHVDSRTDCYDDPNFAFSCFNGFIRNGRLKEAIEAIYLSDIREYKRIKSVLNDILDYCANNIDIEAYKHVEWSSCFENLFKEISFEKNEELLELAELEWNIFPYLCWGRSLLFITKAVYTEPSFYIKLIEFVNKFQIKSNNKRYLLSKSEQNLWLFTEIILDKISDSEKEFDIYSDNNYWLKTVEKIVHEKGLWKIYSHYLCRILANSPEDKDGVWPCHCLENYLERQSDDFLEQFKEFKFNIADPLKIDTGVLTNKKADDFFANSKALEIDHPRLAKVLRELSDYYRRLAEDEKDFFKRHNDYYSD